MFRSVNGLKSAAGEFHAEMSRRRGGVMPKDVCSRRIARYAGCRSWSDIVVRIGNGTLPRPPVDQREIVDRLVAAFVLDIERNPLCAFSSVDIVRHVKRHLPPTFAASAFSRSAMRGFAGYCLAAVWRRDIDGHDFTKRSLAAGFANKLLLVSMTAPPSDRPFGFREIPARAVDDVFNYLASIELLEQGSWHQGAAHVVRKALDAWHVSVELREPKRKRINPEAMKRTKMTPIASTPVAGFAAFMAKHDENTQTAVTAPAS